MKLFELNRKKPLRESVSDQNILNLTPLELLVEMSLKHSLPPSKIVEELVEKAPPGAKAERFIKQSKEDFKKRYGDRWQEVLYATAWKKFGESMGDDNYPALDLADARKAVKLFKEYKRLRGEFAQYTSMGRPTEEDTIRVEMIGDQLEKIKSDLYMMKRYYDLASYRDLADAANLTISNSRK